MKKIISVFALMSLPVIGYAELAYFNAKIARIETCKSGSSVYVFLKELTSGSTTPSASNGCSNDVAMPYVRLNGQDGTVSELEKIMFSTALTAKASDSQIRVRFDTETKQMISIAID